MMLRNSCSELPQSVHLHSTLAVQWLVLALEGFTDYRTLWGTLSCPNGNSHTMVRAERSEIMEFPTMASAITQSRWAAPCAPPLWWWQRLWHPVPHTGDSNCCKTPLRGLPLKIPHKAQHWECNGNQNENVFQWGWQHKTQKLNFIKTLLFWWKGWLQCVTS